MKELGLKEIQKVELDMLGYIDEICTKNDIKYTVTSGTALGTIRHNGFIPWDDDIDIGLDRKNYYKLIEALKNGENKNYKVLTHDIEKTYGFPFAKLVDLRTVLIHKNQIPIKDYGVFIDIFKYDGLPKNSFISMIYFYRIKFMLRCINTSMFYEDKEERLLKRIIKKFFLLYAKIKGRDALLKKYTKLSEKYDIDNTDYCMINWPVVKRKNQMVKTKFFKEFIRHKFEDIEINVMKDYDEYLTIAYGDYMTPPPEDKRVAPHVSEIYWKDSD